MPASSPLVLIAAVARNGVIGRDGVMPWHLPQDLRHFRELTLGHTVVMGRRTWESLAPKFRPLPRRRNIVVSRDANYPAAGATLASSLTDAIALARQNAGQRVFLIGGAQLYAQALPLADELELTELHADVAGDTVFPTWNRGDFEETRRTVHAADPAGAPAFDFVTYRRKS
jgi:dihydrofolate reductase